jgi:glutaredoxin
MKPQLKLYTRKDCCLCEEMKATLEQVARRMPLVIEEIDVDTSADLREKYGDEVPVLFINGRKAFKYRVKTGELQKRLKLEASLI